MTPRAQRATMRRSNRLTSAGRIRSVYESGRRASAPAVACSSLIRAEGSSHADPPRVAVVAGRKVGGAVTRNRAKRRLRAAVEPLVARMPSGAEVVLGATARTNELGFREVAADVEAVLTRVGALR